MGVVPMRWVLVPSPSQSLNACPRCGQFVGSAWDGRRFRWAGHTIERPWWHPSLLFPVLCPEAGRVMVDVDIDRLPASA
jgi:hypothetical protein